MMRGLGPFSSVVQGAVTVTQLFDSHVAISGLAIFSSSASGRTKVKFSKSLVGMLGMISEHSDFESLTFDNKMYIGETHFNLA